MGASLLRRLTLCKLRMCPHKPGGSDTHLWGECTICGSLAGVVSREAVRRYIRAQELDGAAKRAAIANKDTPDHG